MTPFLFQLPTKIVFGAGCLSQLPEEASVLSLTGRNCLVVCGRRFARQVGLLERVCGLLRDMRCEFAIFDQVEPNPLPQTVLEGASQARKLRARWLLALGGGSAIDAAKAIALLAVNQGQLLQFSQGMRPEAPPLALVAVPTTAGTGSEVTPYAILTNSKLQDKFALNFPELFPRLALLDPELTLSLPEPVTVDTGLDALSHALEAYFSRRRSALSDLMAGYAMGLMLRNLPIVRRQPANLEARFEMLLGSTAAGAAIANTGTLVPHALSYPVTVRFNLPHGRAVALLLTGFLEKMVEIEPERARQVGALLGDAAAPAGALRGFIESLGVAPRLAAWGVREGAVEEIVKLAREKRHCQLSPGEWSEASLAQVFRLSL